jgi:AraC-like DNA-binding protein
MQISFVQPRNELCPYLESFWVFESAIGMPRTERSMATPNGCAKLIIPYENSLTSTADGRVQVSREHGLYFVGNRDTSTMIQSSPTKTGFIAIEFCPFGAYPFFGIPMDETVNRLLDSDEVFGRWGRNIREVLCNLDRVDQKLDFVQEQLVALLRRNQRDNTVIEFCVNTLKAVDGRLPIHELERRTGYSRRYLDMLFRKHVGFAPKTLAGIFRFQKFYRQWAQGLSFDRVRDDLYEYYYDQAHFTKEFKRMTGYSPRRFTREVSNEFGRRITLK